MKAIGDIENVNLSTGEMSRRIAGDGESILVKCRGPIDFARLGPSPEVVFGPRECEPTPEEIVSVAQGMLKTIREKQMSWSASGTIKSGQFTEKSKQTQTGNGEAESKLALEAAKAAALSLVCSGKLGQGEFSVNMSGHANNGNKPQKEWSNDFLTITINQTP